jgi:membrane protein YdbS with pleckstrin-like domain
MARVEPLLHRDEYPLIETRSHPAILLRPALWTAAVLVMAGAIGFVFSPSTNNDLVDSIVGGVALVFSLNLLWKVLDRKRKKVVLTDRRIIVMTGVLSRKVSTLPLSRVRDINYRRSVLGRALGYGSLEVSRSGSVLDGPWLRIERLPRPDHFYRTLASVVASRRVVEGEEGPQVPLDEADTGPLPRVVV